MRRIPARIRFAPRTGLRKSAVAPRRCMWRWHFYNRSSAVFCDASHVGTCQWRMVFCDAPHVGACQWRMFFCDAPHVGAYRWMVVLSTGDGNPMTKATAEERLYNHSPRLASLPGGRAERINLPPKSGCINHGKYFSKLSQPPRHK